MEGDEEGSRQGQRRGCREDFSEHGYEEKGVAKIMHVTGFKTFFTEKKMCMSKYI